VLFNSLEFLLFFPIVLILFFYLSERLKWIFLLIASYIFYMSWKWEYIILILISTMVDYWAGLKMGTIEKKSKRKKFLLLSIFSNLGILFSFKYFNFFSHSIGALLSSQKVFYDIPTLDVLLPVGISFYTFQTLSYSIEIYRGKIKPERNLGKFALYVAYFPQLVAGPIERPGHLLPQLWKKLKLNGDQVASGLKLILWGYFKKVCIADRLAEYVNIVYNDPNNYYGLSIWIATIFFSFQIYCDFSGYSDIAIGSARIMGIDLMKNFRTPYFSQSIAEFWRRWHISLSYWFRDYVYIPLGGNRVKLNRWYFNLFVTFLLSGLWHGANWTFVIWGGLHGLYMILANVRDRLIYKIKIANNSFTSNRLINVFSTFSLVLFSWIFFRANNLQESIIVIRNAFNFSNFNFVLIEEFDFLVSWYLLGILLIAEYLHEKKSLNLRLKKYPILVRWSLYSFFIILILFLGVFFEKQEFIYFQF